MEPGDVVVLHDPQTAGLVPALKRQGRWSSGAATSASTTPNDLARTAWEFLRPAVQEADAYVFSRAPTAGRGWIGRGWPSLRRASTLLPPRTRPWNHPPSTPSSSSRDPGRSGRQGGAPGLASGWQPGRVVRRAEMIQHQPIPPSPRWWSRCHAGIPSRTPWGCWRGSPLRP